MSSAAEPDSGTGPAVPRELILRALELLPHNDIACNARLVSKDAEQRFRKASLRTVFLSLPLSEHAADCWLQHASAGAKKLSFNSKLGSLIVAAKSGSQENLRAAWQLLQRSIFPELTPEFYTDKYSERLGGTCPSIAAARACNAPLLPWLLANRCPTDPVSTVEAIAECCDLATLQFSLQQLQPRLQFRAASRHPPEGFPTLSQPAAIPPRPDLCAAAARSRTHDSIAKMEWVTGLTHLPAGLTHTNTNDTDPFLASSCCTLRPEHAVEAAKAGNAQLVLWITQHTTLSGDLIHNPSTSSLSGAMTNAQLLSEVFHHCSLPDLEMLLREGALTLPAPADNVGWLFACCGAAASGSETKLRWLRNRCRGRPLHRGVLQEAAASGNLPAVRYLYDECGQPLGEEAFAAAVRSGSVPLATWLLERGCPTGHSWPLVLGALRCAERDGGAMLRWLVGQGSRVPRDALVGHDVVVALPARFRGGEDATAAAAESLPGPASASAGSSGRCGSSNSSSAASGAFDSIGTEDGAAEGRQPEETDVRQEAQQQEEQEEEQEEEGSWFEQGRVGALRLLEAGGWRVAADAALEAACLLGDLQLLRYLHQVRGFPLNPAALLRPAASGGCEALVEWLVRRQRHNNSSSNSNVSSRRVSNSSRSSSSTCRANKARSSSNSSIVTSCSGSSIARSSASSSSGGGAEGGGGGGSVSNDGTSGSASAAAGAAVAAAGAHGDAQAAPAEGGGGGAAHHIGSIRSSSGSSGGFGGGTKSIYDDAEAGAEAYLAAGANGDLATLECLRRLGLPCDMGVVLRAMGSGVQGLEGPVAAWLARAVGEDTAARVGRLSLEGPEEA